MTNQNLTENELRSRVMDGHDSKKTFNFKFRKNYFGNESDAVVTKLFKYVDSQMK